MDTGVAGEIIATIGGMATATKSVAEAIKTVRTKVQGNKEAERILFEVSDQVISLQSRMMDLQVTVLNLQQENAKLRDQLRHAQERFEDRKKFQLKKVKKAVVMVVDSEPGIYYCPTCFEKNGNAIPLQQIDHGEHSHMCFTCQTVFSLLR